MATKDDATRNDGLGEVGPGRARRWRLLLGVVLGAVAALLVARRVAGTFLNAMYGT